MLITDSDSSSVDCRITKIGSREIYRNSALARRASRFTVEHSDYAYVLRLFCSLTAMLIFGFSNLVGTDHAKSSKTKSAAVIRVLPFAGLIGDLTSCLERPADPYWTGSGSRSQFKVKK